MEFLLDDIGIILLIMVAVSIKIFGTVAQKKAKEAGNKTPAMEEPAQERIFGNEAPAEPEVIMPTAKAHKKRQNKPKQARKAETIESPKSAAGQVVADTPKSATDDRVDESNRQIEDFDIQRAIIYTEIMTPKFKEE